MFSGQHLEKPDTQRGAKRPPAERSTLLTGFGERKKKREERKVQRTEERVDRKR